MILDHSKYPYFTPPPRDSSEVGKLCMQHLRSAYMVQTWASGPFYTVNTHKAMLSSVFGCYIVSTISLRLMIYHGITSYPKHQPPLAIVQPPRFVHPQQIRRLRTVRPRRPRTDAVLAHVQLGKFQFCDPVRLRGAAQ